MNNENDITRKYTDEQIWEMLKPKMEKMGVQYRQGVFTELGSDSIVMDIGCVMRLVATIYRSGYVRGQKGRSFIIGEKKKRGHWESCYKGEKLPEGTKVKLNKKVKLTGDIWHFTENSIGYSTKEGVSVFTNDTWILFEGEERPFYFGELTDKLLKWVEE